MVDLIPIVSNFKNAKFVKIEQNLYYSPYCSQCIFGIYSLALTVFKGMVYKTMFNKYELFSVFALTNIESIYWKSCLGVFLVKMLPYMDVFGYIH